MENKKNSLSVKFAKKSNGNKLVKIKLDDYQINWKLEDAKKVDASEVDSLSSLEKGKAHYEESANKTEEPFASILTESPDAAASGITDEKEAEEKFGNKLSDDPKNNTTDGILPEEQESWQETDEDEEETLDMAYYDSIEAVQESNDKKMKVDNLSSSVVYEDILPNVNLEYQIISQKVKENIVLKSADVQTEFVFQFQVKGLTPVQKENTILFQNENQTTVFEIQPPFMYDANGEHSQKVALELVPGNGNKCEIKLTVDEAWLKDEERAFPVVVDPVIQTSQDSSYIQDAHVLANYPTTNYYVSEVLKTGVSSTDGLARSFLRFDLPELQSGDMVVDARLNLYAYSESSSNVSVTVHEVISEWSSSTITWENQPYGGVVEDYETFVPSLGELVSLSITGVVKRWYEGYANNGVMLKASKESGRYAEYISSDYSSADVRPSILITYVSCTGLEDYWTYHSQDVGRAGTGYVNDYTGNLVFQHGTVATSGNRMPLALVHVYNTNDKDTNLDYGYGWRLNYLQTVKSTTISDTEYYEYVDEDGTLHYFCYDSEEEKWLDESGIDLELTVGSSSSEKYIINDKSDNQLIFDSDGKLIKIKDQNGNAITIAYTGTKISTITDGVGRSVTLAYNSSGLLSTVTDPSGRIKQFGYSGNLLTTITDTDGEQMTYTYSGNAMSSATDIDGYCITYQYSGDAPYRISAVSESAEETAGQEFSIYRESNFTRFIDNKGRLELYLFNNAGNTISIVDETNGRGQMAKYLTEGTNKNKISKVSNLTLPVVNLLKNPYFSDSSDWTLVQNNATATLTTGSSNAREGTKSFRMTSTQSAGETGIKQSVSLEAGEDYTLSVYAKTDEANLQQDKAVVQIHVLTSAGTNLYSDGVDYYEAEDGWYRLMTTLSVPSGTQISSADVYIGIEGIADVYFDCVQLEKGMSAGHFNLIENGDFRYGTDGFTLSNSNALDEVKDLGLHQYTNYINYRKGVVYNTTSLNMRTGPGASNSLVTAVKQGTYITILGEGVASNGVIWYYTYYINNGQLYSGYMSSAYIDVSEGYTGYSYTGCVDAISLNVRNGAGAGYDVLTLVYQDEAVQVLETVTASNGQVWAVVTFTRDGTRYVGMVLADYIYNYWTETMIGEIVGDVMDYNSFYMYGNPIMVKRVTQTLDIAGSAGDVYRGSLWGSGYALPLKDSRSFGLEVEFVASDGTKESYVSNFEAASYLWQYLSDVFIPTKDYVKINVSCICGYNGNVVAFDGLSLFREDFAQSYTYDENGNVLSVKDLADKQSSFEYDGNDNLKSLTDAKGNKFAYTYDTSHNITKAVSAANMVYTFTYDSYGNPVTSKVVNATNESQYIQSSAAYTDNGNYQESVTDPLGNTVENEYDLIKGLIQNTTDAMGYDTAYTYDAMDRLTKVTKTDALGFTTGTAEVTYTYEDDTLKTITHNGFQYTFEEDVFGNSTAVYAAGNLLARYVYEENNGNLLEKQYANGYTYVYEYDNLDRVTEVRLKYSDGEECVLYRYEYNGDGNLAVEYDIREDIGMDTVVTQYFYDLSGRLVYLKTGSDEDYRYVYDLNDNLIKIIQGNKFRTLTTVYNYDADNRETSTQTQSKAYSTVYDALGRVTSRTWNTTTPYAVQYTYQAGAGNSLSTQVQKVTSGGNDTTYTYDQNGNITSIVSESGIITYEYDELNQLVRENNSALNQTIGYVYDLGGNLKEKRIYAYLPNKTISELAATTPQSTITYGYDSTWKDLLVSYNGQTISYDAMGNPLQYRGIYLGWMNRNELTEVVVGDESYAYSYNKDGLRNRKYMSDGTVSYQTEGSMIVGEWKTGTSGNTIYELEFIYDSAGNLISMVYNGTEYYYIRNLQGDIVGILDGQGNTVVTYTYDSWGKLLEMGGNQTIGQVNPFRYRGYYYDSETGWYYLKSRYYDPEVGRFLNTDNVAVLVEEHEELLQYNLFAYCWNNPVNMSDSEGESPANIIGAIAGGVGGAALGIVIANALGLKGAKRKALIVAATASGAILGAFLGPYVAKLGSKVAAKLGIKKTAKKGVSTATKKANPVGCFVEGTLVATKDGMKPIEQIKAGELVYSENPETGECGLKEVVETFVNEATELIHIFVKDEEIIATQEHPFYVPKKGWVGAVDLRAGDILVLRSGEYVVVEKVQHEILEAPIVVYNFEVADFHTYYVSNINVLVHNMCDLKSSIKKSSSLVREADKLTGRLQDEANTLIREFLNGNANPGLGTKHLAGDIYYLRGRNGARVFYRMKNGVMDILGKATKANEQTVINLVLRVFGGK